MGYEKFYLAMKNLSSGK